jgi:ABC-2 type transport system permease protein
MEDEAVEVGRTADEDGPVQGISRTLQQALLLSFFGLFPLMFLSGTVAPVESMPEALQVLSLASPLRYYMDVILGVFLKGAGFAELWPQALALLGIGTLFFLIAAGIFGLTTLQGGA